MRIALASGIIVRERLRSVVEMHKHVKAEARLHPATPLPLPAFLRPTQTDSGSWRCGPETFGVPGLGAGPEPDGPIWLEVLASVKV